MPIVGVGAHDDPKNNKLSQYIGRTKMCAKTFQYESFLRHFFSKKWHKKYFGIPQHNPRAHDVR